MGWFYTRLKRALLRSPGGQAPSLATLNVSIDSTRPGGGQKQRGGVERMIAH